MDKINKSLISISLIASIPLLIGRKQAVEGLRVEKQDSDIIVPGITLNDFVSTKYKISFKYPASWRQNPRYEEKYEGTNGFFEVGDFEGVGENIDEAVQSQINEDYRPYGSSPIVRSFNVDGQPARVIYPSADQPDFFRDREAAIVVQYPTPLTVEGKTYEYVVIWASRDYIPLILSTFKFTEGE